jgi:hypothetical protein
LFAVIGLTFRLFFGRFGKVIGISALVLLPMLAASAGGQLANVAFAGLRGSNGAISMTQALSIGAICLGLLVLVLGALYPWMEGALTHNVIEHVLGRNVGVGASYSAARPQWGALWVSNAARQIVIYIALAIAGIVAGMMFGPDVLASFVNSAQNSGGLNLPIIILLALCAPLALIVLAAAFLIAMNWSLRAPAIIGEGLGGFESLGRSNALVSGNRWRLGIRLLPMVLLELLTVSLPAAFVTSVTNMQTFQQAGAAMVQQMLPIAAVAVVASALISLIAKPWQIIYMAVNYLDLRARKEDLAAIVGTEAGQIAPQPTAIQVSPAAAADATAADSVYTGQMSLGVRIGALIRRLRIEPDNAQLNRELAEAYEGLGDIGGAISAWGRVRELDAANAEPLLRIARLQLRRRDRDAATRSLADYMRVETDPIRLDDVRNDGMLSPLLPQS